MELEILRRVAPEATARPPLVFVHGAWHGAWCWDEAFLPYFAAAGYDVIAVGLRGHGGSPGREVLNRFRMRDYVDDVVSVLETLERPPVLVGHSMGGAVVQGLLAREDAPPLAGAALLATVPSSGVAGLTARVALRAPWQFVRANLTWNLGVLVEQATDVRHLFFGPDLSDADLARHHARLHSESYRAFLDLLVLDPPRPRPVDTPVLVLAAANDTIFTLAEQEQTAAAWGADLVVIEGLAHDVMLDTRWSDAADALLDWILTSGQPPVREE